MEIPWLNYRLSITSPWSWWLAELRGMLPATLRRALSPGIQRLYLQASDGRLLVSQGGVDAQQVVARFDLADDADEQPVISGDMRNALQSAREVVLCLPRDKAMIRTLALPLAALENLREVLGFEIDRQTPVRIDEVYYDYRIAGRKPAENSIEVDLVVTPRAYLDRLLERLSVLGFHPQQVTIWPEGNDAPLAINLLQERDRQRRPDRARYLNITLALLAIVLLTSAVAMPLLKKQRTIGVLEARLALTTEQAKAAQHLRAQLERLERESRFLVNRKQSRPLVLEVMNELTRILPDDTWITRLETKGLEVQLQGQSQAAAALIPLIESSPLFENARFRSPVTRIQRSDDERFHLSAAISPGSPP